MLVAEILRRVGDWCIAFDIPQWFGNAHELAWNYLATVDDGERIRQEWYGTPTLIYLPPLQSSDVNERGDMPTGRVVLEFTVNKRGTVNRVEVVASTPEGALDQEATQRIKQARFRPRMEDGQFVRSAGHLVMEMPLQF